jgi:hypothetical protein
MVEVVRGDLTEERAGEILDFWSRSGAFPGEAARERLPDVVCVAIDDAGEVVGVNSVEDRMAPTVGRRLWVYRRLLAEYSDDLSSAMFNAAFEALAEEFEGGDAGPIGLCIAVEDREAIARHPEAIWPETELVFAGHLPDGRQLRLRYFRNATVGPGAFDASNIDQLATREYPVDDRFEIVPLAESDSVTADDVLALWSREGVVADEVARRRIDQVQLVAVADGSEVVGVSSTFLERRPRLGVELWNYRTFVASGYRHSSLAAQLLFGNLELLERRFVSGEDTRAQGLLFELENEDVMRGLNVAVWPQTGYTFIGENTRGSHVRVRYFPGAKIPRD